MTDVLRDLISVALMFGLPAVIAAILTRWGHRRDNRRRRHPQTGAIGQLAAKHAGQSGLIVEVFWPVVPRSRLDATVESVLCVEQKRFLGSKRWFSRHGLERQRPFWVAMTPGKHYVRLETYGKRPETKELRIDLKPGEHKLVLCWPAKRGFVTPERRWTEWQIVPLP